MLRICLIIAILGGLGAGALSWFQVQDIITTTRAARDDWHNQFTSEHTARTTAESNLKKKTADLEKTTKQLAQTKTDLDAATTKVTELDKQNTDLTDKLAKTTAARDEAQQELEQWHLIPGGLKPGQIKGLIEELAKTKEARDTYIAENKLVTAKYNEIKGRWDDFFGTNGAVPLPAGLKGKVIAVDPKFDFVVLNIGDEQGARKRGEMMVDRDGKLIGKVRISTVEKDHCVANILPDWKQGDIMEGDEVLY
jgi:polyhydroxyalkanoate synthesis regulator phasin